MPSLSREHPLWVLENRFTTLSVALFLKLDSENSTVFNELILKVAVNFHRDSSGINGLVLTLLVFGAFPRMPVRTIERTFFQPLLALE